jgi:multiple sugar transport system substrate-binding protein
MKRYAAFFFALAAAAALLLPGCAGEQRLDPRHPVTLTLWHNFGSQMEDSMSALVDEFNATTGREHGVLISVTSVSSSASIQEKLTMIASGDPGAPEMPDITTCYPATAVLLQEKGLIAPLDTQFTEEELEAYLPRFVEEGRLSDGKLYVFPFAKSTEVLFLNQTLFDRFAVESGASLEDLSTFEGLARTAVLYYEWTDAKTPDIPDDGSSFYTADSVFNLAQVGMCQMGSSLLQDGRLNVDAPEFERVWNVLFEPAVKGGYAIYDGYSSDLSKTGEIVCSTGSTAGITFYGSTITYPDNTTENVEYTVLPFPVFEGGAKAAIQRGSGMVVAKSTPQREKAAAAFLKWFTAPQQNMRFVASTGYLPVTDEAFGNSMEQEIAANENVNIKKLLKTAVTVYREYSFYIPPVFDGFNTLEDRFEKGFHSAASKAREQYLSRKETVSPGQAYAEAAAEALEGWKAGL